MHGHIAVGVGQTAGMGETSHIRYDLRGHGPAWAVWAYWAQAVVWAAQGVVAWSSGRSLWWTGLCAVLFLLFLGFAVGQSRPVLLVVDARGVKRPLRRAIPWSQIARVMRPGRWDDRVRIRLHDGRTVALGLPASHAEQVARIGGLTLEDAVTQ